MLGLAEYVACRIGSHASTLVGVVLYSVCMFHIEIVSCVVWHIQNSIILFIGVGVRLYLGYFFLVWADTIIFLVRIHQV